MHDFSWVSSFHQVLFFIHVILYMYPISIVIIAIIAISDSTWFNSISLFSLIVFECLFRVKMYYLFKYFLLSILW